MASQFTICSLFCLLFSCILHGMVKGAAPDGQLYVYSSHADGCATIEKSRQGGMRCPANKPVPLSYAKYYEANNGVINASLELLDNPMSLAGKPTTDCLDAMNSVMCVQITPECLRNGTEINYGNTTQLCDKVKATCPKNIGADSDFCNTVLSGNYNDGECVAPSKQIDGVCPQPEYKMPPALLEQYEKTSKQFTEMFSAFTPDNPILSQECLKKMKDVFCLRVICSKDGKQLLIKQDENDCNDAVQECFGKPGFLPPIEAVKKMMKDLQMILRAHCFLYPSNTTETKDTPKYDMVVSTTAGPSVVEGLKTHPNGTAKSPSSASNLVVPRNLMFVFLLFKLFA